MLKKTITYQHLDGEEVTEDFYFSLSKADLIELELGAPGGLSAHLQRMVADQNGEQIYAAFTNLVRKAYGKKSEDGKRFLKSPELWYEFSSSGAYSELVTDLMTNEQSATEFVNGIIPKNLDRDIARAASGPATAEEKAIRKLTKKEIVEMDPTELRRGLMREEFTL